MSLLRHNCPPYSYFFGTYFSLTSIRTIELKRRRLMKKALPRLSLAVGLIILQCNSHLYVSQDLNGIVTVEKFSHRSGIS